MYTVRSNRFFLELHKGVQNAQKNSGVGDGSDSEHRHMVSCGDFIRPENHDGSGFRAGKRLRGNAVRVAKAVAGMPDGHSEVAGEKIGARHHAVKRTPSRSPFLLECYEIPYLSHAKPRPKWPHVQVSV